MNKGLTFLKFIRFPNLVIVGLTQYLIRWCILEPFAHTAGIDLIFSPFHFFILTLTTVLITAGGYIVNDIYDYPIDKVNKPNKVFINTLLSEKRAWQLFYSLNIGSLALTTYLYFAIPNLFIWVFPIALAMLTAMWWYSYRLKKTVLWGNLMVSLFCALVPLSVFLPEAYVLDYNMVNKAAKIELETITIAYMVFAFVSTLLREIIKDIEDHEGDSLENCKTLPIVYGVKRAKQIANFTAIILLGLLGFAIYFLTQQQELLQAGYATIFIAIPVATILIRLQKAQKKSDFKLLSTLAKFVMLTGLLYLIVHIFG